jgi:hypothetical protein
VLRREKHREALVAALLMLQDLAYPRARDGRDCLQTRLCWGGFVHSSGQSWLRRRRRRHKTLSVLAAVAPPAVAPALVCARASRAILSFIPWCAIASLAFCCILLRMLPSRPPNPPYSRRASDGKSFLTVERSRLVVEVEEHRDDLNSTREVVQLVSHARS